MALVAQNWYIATQNICRENIGGSAAQISKSAKIKIVGQ